MRGFRAALAAFAASAAILGGERLLAPTFGDTRPVLTAVEVAFAAGIALGWTRPRAAVWTGAALAWGFVLAAAALARVPPDLLSAPVGTAVLAFAAALGALGAAGWSLATAARRPAIPVAAMAVGGACGLVAVPFAALPLLGTRGTLVLAAALCATSAWPRPRRAARRSALAALAVLAVGSAALVQTGGHASGWSAESPEGHVAVIRRGAAETLSTGGGTGVQSRWDSGATLSGMYTDDLALAPFALTAGRRPLRALMIGVGGGTGIRLWRRFGWPEGRLAVDGVELDPAVARAARERFALGSSGVRLFVGDGRPVLSALRGPYDLVVLDAYAHEAYLPFALTTQQADRLVRARLRPEGEVWLNVNAPSRHDRLLRSLFATLRTVFPEVRVSRARGAFNWLIVAGGRDLPARLAALRSGPAALPGALLPVARALRFSRIVTAGAPVLTDDRADVEGPADAAILDLGWRRISTPAPATAGS